MPIYYFNVYNDEVSMDPEGLELADVDTARAFALKAARSLGADSVLHGHLIGSHRVEIVDENQKPVGSIRFDEAVEIKP